MKKFNTFKVINVKQNNTSVVWQIEYSTCFFFINYSTVGEMEIGKIETSKLEITP